MYKLQTFKCKENEKETTTSKEKKKILKLGTIGGINRAET